MSRHHSHAPAAAALACAVLLASTLSGPALGQRGDVEVQRTRHLPEQPAWVPWSAEPRVRSERPLLPGNRRPRLMLTGYWPPTNEMIRRFSTNPALNPDGWIGRNWEGRGYNIFSYFPEFDPPNCNQCGKGFGDLEVDYQDTTLDGKTIADTLDPVAIITFSRGFIDHSWEVEMNQYNRLEWINDYLDPRQPTPVPPDATVPADWLRLSGLPVQEIVDAIDAAQLGLDPYINWTGDGGGFLSEFAAYHGTWYQAAYASPKNPNWCVAGGHVHVGGEVDWDTATLATEVTVRTVLDYVDGLIYVEQCQRDLGYRGPGTATLSVCGDTLRTGGEVQLFLRNATADHAAWLIMGPELNPHPYAGGQVAPFPPEVVYTFLTNAQGQVRVPGLPRVHGRATRYIQVIYEDLNQPEGRGFSNAVELKFLGPADG